jgi:spoIIIJ-associated protein
MGIKAVVSYRYATDLVEPDEAPPLVLDITGGDLGILIGRRSETLQAVQDMVRIMVSKELSSWQPLIVDVESYRVRRRQSLRQMAEKMAERVTASRKKMVLEAMPAHERRIIHIALRDHPAVITKSIGSDDNRKVTIIPK